MTHHGHHHSDADGRAEPGSVNVANETAAAEALNTPRATEEPNYVAEVLKSYIDNKQKQGDSNEEISTKLNYLQLKFPHFDHIAAQVREQAGLPKKP